MAGQIKDHSNSTKVPAQQLVTHSEVNMPLELRLVVTKFPNIGVKSQIRYDTIRDATLTCARKPT